MRPLFNALFERRTMKRRSISKSERAREERLRRHARRHGLALVKSPSGKAGSDFGGFMIVEPTRGVVVAGGSPHPFSLSLEDVEARLLL